MTYTPPEGVIVGAFTADTLPASFRAPADAVISYKIYGTSAGAGVETESGEPTGYKIPISLTDGTSTSNYDLFIGDSKLSTDDFVDYGEQKVYKITPNNGVSAGNANPQYTIVNNGDGSYRVYHNTISASYECIKVMPYISGVVHFECDITFNKITTKGFSIGLRRKSNDSFYPEGGSITVKATGTYKIRKTIDTGDVKVYFSVVELGTSAGTAQEYDYTITNIRLYANPQDPPAPFPTLTTYIGENTISSTETLGDVEFTGEWSAIMGSTEDESIDIEFTVDAEEYIAFATIDDGPSIQVSDTITMPSSADSFTLDAVAWGRERYTDTVYNALS